MATHKWSDIKNNLSPERKEKIESEVKEAINNMPPIHPGEVLLREYVIMEVAYFPDISPDTLCDLILGKINITEEIAKTLSREYETTEEFWLNLQSEYDKKKAQ